MTGGKDDRFVQLLQQLSLAVQENDPAARGKILSLLKKTPQEPNLLHLAGLACLRNGDHQGAITYFEKSLKSHQQQPDLHNNLANAYKALGQFAAAEQHYREALALRPRYQDAWKNLGLLLITMKQYAEAEQALQKALELTPNSAGILTALGNVRRGEQQYEGAIDYYRRALAIDPNYVNALHNLGQCYKDLEQPGEALAFYERAQQLAPQLAVVDLNHGNALFELGRYEEAETSYQNAVKKAPRLVTAHETLSEFYWQLGKHERVEESYRSAIQVAPDDLQLRLSLLKLLIATGKFEAAKSLTEESLQRIPGPELFHLQGKLFANELEYPAALQSFEKSLAGDFKLEPAQDLVKVHIILGAYDKALPLVDRAQQLAPNDQLSWALKGLCWRLTNDPRYHWLIDYERHIQAYTLPTPRGYSSLAGFLEDLERVLVGMHSTKFAPSQQTLKHGTQTPGRLLYKKQPEIRLYKELLTEVVRDYISHMPDDSEHPLLGRKSQDFIFAGSWSVKLHSGGFHVNHIHPQGWISSACYITLPEQVSTSAGTDGCIKFGESGLGLGDREVIERTIRPQAGQLVLFPSYTWHGTHSFECDEDDYRLTAPFDVIPNKR